MLHPTNASLFANSPPSKGATINNSKSAMNNPECLRLLITGMCGFAGSVIARHLLEHSSGLSIIGFDNLSRKGSETNLEPLRKLGIHVLVGDVRDRAFLDSLPAADWILDCAANPSVLAGVDGSDTRDLIDQNLYGTINLLELCKRWNAGFTLLSTSRVYSTTHLANLPLKETPTRFVPDLNESSRKKVQKLQHSDSNASSIVPYCGYSFPGLSPSGVTESFPTTPPVSLYGSTKLCSEILALEYGESFNFPVWINRCGVLAGDGQFGKVDQGIFSYWIRSWIAGRPLRYIGFGGRGLQVRDCLHPKDLAPLLLKQFATRHPSPATLKPPPPPARIINCSGGAANTMSLLELSTWCAAHFGPHPITARKDSPPSTRHAARACESRRFDIPWLVLDPTLAKQTWDWSPATPIETILEEIAQHAEANPGWLKW